MNPFFNPHKVMQALPNMIDEQTKQTLLLAIQQRSPKVLQRLVQVYANPCEALMSMYSGNPQAQQQIASVLQNKSIGEQRSMLIAELEQSGINVKGIAQQFGVRL